ncbi:hypothetical protein Tco_1493113 [Tanacetum coccineum]
MLTEEPTAKPEESELEHALHHSPPLEKTRPRNHVPSCQPFDDLEGEVTSSLITFRRMPFGLCNAPGTFQRCMLAIFHDMVEKTMEVFMDDFSVFGNSFQNCLSRLDHMLQRCEDTNLSLNWEKSHFMVKEGIVLGHKISKKGIEYVEASPPNSEPVSSKVMEIVIPEIGRIEDDILLIKDDTLREKLLNVNRLVAKIKALKDNPVPSSIVVTKSTSTFPNLFLEETNTFDNSLPESETFCFNLEEPSSGSPTTPSDLSLPDYEAFSNDHIEETSSGSTTTYSDSSFSKYDSFIFDLSINSYHPSNRSDFHEEFADELAQIISQPEYDCFFKDEPELGSFTMDVVGNIFQTREPRVHVLNVLPTLELDFIPSSESIFAYVVWIFLPFLFIPVIPPYLLSCGDEDTIFDPGISKDCPDCEDSQFCHSSRVSHPQLHLGIRYPNLID